jgi:hypothetical protein
MVHPPEILMAEQLTLRRPSVTDAADVYAYAHDPEVTRYMVWPTHREIDESITFLESCGPRWEAGDEYCWVITITPEDRAVGIDWLSCRSVCGRLRLCVESGVLGTRLRRSLSSAEAWRVSVVLDSASMFSDPASPPCPRRTRTNLRD